MCVCAHPVNTAPKRISWHITPAERGDEKRAFFILAPLYTRPGRVMMPFVTVEITERDILAVPLLLLPPPALSLSLCIFFTAPLFLFYFFIFIFFSAFEKKKKKTGINIFTIRVRVYLVLPPAKKREEGRVAVLGRGR